MKYLKQRLLSRVCGGSLAVLTVAAMTGMPTAAKAYTFNTSPDWDIELDTNLAYTLGFRAQPQNSLIADNPIQQNNEFKFAKAGDIISNRVDVATELTASYQQKFGFDVSVDGWKDFAYNGGVATNPGEFAPGTPYSALSSSPDGRYGSYTLRNYNVGGELENAFAFGNFSMGGVPVEVKVGRLTEYWGNALFSGGQAISYGQSPVDIIKAVDAPGTEVKDLFLPRGQVTVHAQVLPDLTIGFQYAFEYRYDQLPEGGTFMGIVDPLWIGPQSLEGAGSPPRGTDNTPPNVDGNFGIEALWTPSFLNGTIGFYGRQFDDVAPAGPFAIAVVPTVNYHLAYGTHEHLFGASLDTDIGPVSTGFEASIRQNTALFTVAGGNPVTDPSGTNMAKGNLLNLVANGVYGLTPTPLWQTGSLVGEMAFTHVLAVTHDKAEYNAEGYACSKNGLSPGGEVDGCATTNELNVNVLFDPQWLQVFPGIDLDAPFYVGAGLYGNGQTIPTSGTGNQAGSAVYSAAINALFKQKYDVKLFYQGFTSPTGAITHTPLGKPYYSAGSGQYMWNDKGQVMLVLSTSF
jgi:hypothetical protein